MSAWVLPVTHLLHVFGTVVWIGGMLMILWVILPASKAGLESPLMVGNVMKEVAKRFTPLANTSILLLILTGIIIFYYDKNYTSLFDLKNRWNLMIALKHFLVAIMVIIHFYRGLILNPRIEKASSQPNEIQPARLKKRSLDLVKTNFALGIIVLLLTGISVSV